MEHLARSSNRRGWSFFCFNITKFLWRHWVTTYVYACREYSVLALATPYSHSPALNMSALVLLRRAYKIFFVLSWKLHLNGMRSGLEFQIYYACQMDIWWRSWIFHALHYTFDTNLWLSNSFRFLYEKNIKTSIHNNKYVNVIFITKELFFLQ